MKFDYRTLKAIEEKHETIGKWNGRQVYACSKSLVPQIHTGFYYIIYDDDNKIIMKRNEAFYCYGFVNLAGSVDEYESPVLYLLEEEEEKEEEVVIGDVKLGIDVDETLKNARNMSIDDLLRGFDYGLES